MTATGIGLASAANFQVTTDSKWKDYEDVVILARLNGAAQRAANTGQTLATSDYTNITNQLRSWLDPKAPVNPAFVDEAAVLRYAIDALVPLVNASPISPLMPSVIGELENTKLTLLMPALDPSRQ